MSGQFSAAILKLERVFKSYEEPTGALAVLQGATVAVRPAEIVLLQGPSGSGKTTLLQIAGCLLRADEGKVEIQGVDVNSASEAERTRVRRDHVGFVFQQFHLVESLSVRDNVALGLWLKKRVANRDLVSQALQLVGLEDKQCCFPRTLSGGEKQRVAMARGIVARPHVLLADEPTSQLDFASAALVGHVIRECVQEFGMATIIATHDERLKAIADRVCTVNKGVLRE